MLTELYVPEVELSYKTPILYDRLPIVQTSKEAHKIFMANWSKQIGYAEEFNALYLDNRFRVLGFSNIGKGGYNSVMVDLRVAFATALKIRANSMIIAHNHPSGSLKPSHHDIKLTEQFAEAGKTLNIRINDHLIVTPQEEFYSFSDNGEGNAFSL